MNNHAKEISKIQAYLRYREARHRSTIEDNNWRVTWMSFLECAFLVAVAIVQVYFLTSLFKDDKRPISAF